MRNFQPTYSLITRLFIDPTVFARVPLSIFASHLSLVSTNIGLVIIVTKSILTHLLTDAKGLMQDIEEKLIRYLLPLLEYRFDPMSHLKKLHLA